MEDLLQIQHLAEFLIRLKPKNNRSAYPVISLALNASTLTACGNDLGFSRIFSRNLEALGQSNDILLLYLLQKFSKYHKCFKKAKSMKIKSVGFLGSGGGKAKKYSNLNIIVPSKITARIQECIFFLVIIF